MQEEFKKKIKNTARKLAAVGAGALMAGATMAGAAFAGDLTDLPAPIVSSGAFDAYVVVGTSATTITAETLKDVAGAIEISTAFGQLATTSTGAEGQATLQVEQFTGESLTAMYLDGDATADPTFHEDVATSTLTATSDLTALDDVGFTTTGGTAINATIGLAIDDDYMEVTRASMAVHINSSTDTANVLQVTLSTNRSGTAKFMEGDKINWFGTLYEIVDVATDANVTLGTTSKVTANKDESFTIGGQTFTLKQVSETQAVITDANGDLHYINSSYTTIGTIDLKSTSIDAVPGYERATFQTVENADKFAVDDLWLTDSDFVIDSMTVNTTAATIDSAIVLRNNVTYDLNAKGAKSAIVEGLDFIYSDNTDDDTAADSLAETGGAGVVWINETSGVTQEIHANYTSALFLSTALSLPGAQFMNYTGVYNDPITTIANLSFGGGDGYLYVKDTQTGNYELRFLPLSGLNVTYSIPEAASNVSSSSQNGDWEAPVTTAFQNHTTPSGIKVSLLQDASETYLELKVAAVEISIDGAAAVYGRKDVSWGALMYSDYGGRVNWASNTVSVTEPNGQSLTIAITFQSDDDAVFNAKSDVKFAGATITATGNTTTTQQDTTHGSNIGYWGSGTFINGTTVDTVLGITMPRKDIVLGVGALQNVTSTLDTDGDDATYPQSALFGNTTVYLLSGAGQSASVNKVTPGIAKLDSEITTGTLAKPVVLLGGPAINSLIKSLVDNGLVSFDDLAAQGTGHAQIDLIENAFNSQTALAIVGYSGADTLMAAKAVAGSLLNMQPFDFSDHNVTTLLLNTGVSAVGDVSVVS